MNVYFVLCKALVLIVLVLQQLFITEIAADDNQLGVVGSWFNSIEKKMNELEGSYYIETESTPNPPPKRKKKGKRNKKKTHTTTKLKKPGKVVKVNKPTRSFTKIHKDPSRKFVKTIQEHNDIVDRDNSDESNAKPKPVDIIVHIRMDE